MQRDRYISQRSEFCKLALNDKKKAAARLRDMATGLENCRTTSDTIYALCNIFAVSERTVIRDVSK